MIIELINFLISTIGSLGYLGIFVLMAIESSFLPLPSELILPPAGVLVAQAKMSFPLVLIFAILGSLVGALFNYLIALALGRPLVERLVKRYGRFVLLNESSLKKTEKFFEEHGSITTFVGRLIPAFRHLISLPAGFAKMNISKFCIFTALGAGIWSTILIFVGYFYGNNVSVINPILNRIGIGLVVIAVVLILVYIIIKLRKKSK